MQFSLENRNDFLVSIKNNIGPSGSLYIRSGSPPISVSASNAGVELVNITLPNEPFTVPTLGYIEKSGSWSSLSATGGGVAGHYRIMSGSTCKLQGTCSAISGSGEMQLSTVNIQLGQPVTVSIFTIIAPGE